MVFTKVLEKDHCLPVTAKFITVKYSLIYSRNWIHEQHHSACEHGTSDSWRSTANTDFANWKMLDCCWKNDCRVTVETVEIAYAVWSFTNNWLYWLKSINNINCHQRTTRSLILVVEMFSVSYVTSHFASFYSVMTALKMSPVIDAFK